MCRVVCGVRGSATEICFGWRVGGIDLTPAEEDDASSCWVLPFSVEVDITKDITILKP